jgi:hypothetical protein
MFVALSLTVRDGKNGSMGLRVNLGCFFFFQKLNASGKAFRPTEHDVSSTDEKDIEVILPWNEGCPICGVNDRR